MKYETALTVFKMDFEGMGFSDVVKFYVKNTAIILKATCSIFLKTGLIDVWEDSVLSLKYDYPLKKFCATSSAPGKNGKTAIRHELGFDGNNLGYAVLDVKKREPSGKDAEIFRAIFNLLMKIYRNFSLVTELDVFSMRKDGADVFNDRYFRSKLQEEVKRADKKRGVVSMIRMSARAPETKFATGRNKNILGAREAIRGCLRKVDALGISEDGDVLIMLPETDGEGAGIVLNRILKKLGETTSLKKNIRTGVSSFPKDGKTPREIYEGIMRK